MIFEIIVSCAFALQPPHRIDKNIDAAKISRLYTLRDYHQSAYQRIEFQAMLQFGLNLRDSSVNFNYRNIIMESPVSYKIVLC